MLLLAWKKNKKTRYIFQGFLYQNVLRFDALPVTVYFSWYHAIAHAVR
jgi:hypothetical protein